MKVTLVGPSHRVGQYVAGRLAEVLPKIKNLGLATGGTQEPLYEALVEMHRRESIDLAEPRGFWGLDEYLGLPRSHPRTYWSELEALLFRHIPEGKYTRYALSSEVADADVPAMCAEYEASISAAGGIDLQLLGLGENCHIAFNEPGSAHDSRTRGLDLTPSTREANSRFFDGGIDEVPQRAASQGIGTIREARRIWLLATGSAKSEAVFNMLEGDVCQDHPASALRDHDGFEVFLDEDAAKLLRNREQLIVVD